MADVTKIDLADGTSLNIKDTVAREKLEDVGASLDYADSTLSLLSSTGEALSSVEIKGGSEPIDAYTKAETDDLLENKQDVLTPLAPLQIQDKLISPIENYTVTDTTIIPNKYNTAGDVPLIVQDGKVGLDLSYAHITAPFVPNGMWSGAGRTFYGFFDGDRFVPVATVKYIMPTNSSTSASYASIIFINAENATSLSEVGYAYLGCRTVSDGTGWRSFVTNNTTGFDLSPDVYGTRATTVGSTLASNFPSNTTVHQLTVNANNMLVLQEWYNNTNGYYLYNVYVGLGGEARALWDKVTHIVTMAFSANAVNKADVRYYTENPAACTLTLAGLNEYSLARPNSIDLENALIQHQMSVKTDSSLTITEEGNLSVNTDAMTFGSELDYDGTNLSLLSPAGDTLSSVEISGGSSDAYTKAETDGLLEKKQDVLTPNDPLKIETVTEAHTNNMSYTSDLSKIYNTDGTKGARMILYSREANRQNMFSNSTSTGFFNYDKATTGYVPLSKEDWLGGYIDIPYTLGDIFKIPRTIADGYSQATLGKTLADGTYIPILPYNWTSSDVTNQCVNMVDKLYFHSSTSKFVTGAENGYAELFSAGRTTATPTVSQFTNLSDDVVYMHLSLVNNVLKYDQLLTATNTRAAFNYVLTTTVANNIAERLAEINTVRWTTYGVFGQNSTSPVEISRFGAYHNTGNKDIVQFSSLSALEAEDYFDLTEITQTTQLDLKVDNTTIKVNSDGNLEAQYPAELNGVKLFPTTQAAYDELAVKDPNTLYIIKQETV